jgi:hypothetical protein
MDNSKKIIKLNPQSYPVDSVMYTGPNGSTRYSNSIDMIKGNMSMIQGGFKNGMMNDSAMNNMFKQKGAVRIGTSKKYKPLDYNINPTYAAGIPYAGISDIVGGVGGMLQGSGPGTVGNYAGNILSNVGSLAGAGASFGPIGAGIGAAAGLGIGIYESVASANDKRKADLATTANNNVMNSRNISDGIAAKYNMRNQNNTRVAGFEQGTPTFKGAYGNIPGMNGYSAFGKGKNRYVKGTPSFKSGSFNTDQTNAYVAPEEVTMDGHTGELNKIPGQYNPNNPDTVSANLTQGTSVFSNQSKQIIPGGKSTPANVMSRATKVQKQADRILNPKEGDRKYSRLDRQTAELNKANIEKAADNLNKYNVIVNNGGDNSNKFAKGTPGYVDRLLGAGADAYNFMNSTWDKFKKDNYYRDPSQWPKEVIAPGSEKKVLDQFNKYNIPPSTPTGNPIHKNRTKLDARTGADAWKKSSITTSADNTEIDSNNFISEHSEIPSPSIPQIPSNNASTVRSKTSSAKGNTNVPVQEEGRLENLKMPLMTTPLTATTSHVDSSKIKIPANIGTNPNSQSPEEEVGTDWGSKLSGIGSQLASLAPVAYNALNSQPEVVNPVYEDFINPNQRYNIAPQMQEQVKQRNIARYNNASTNTSTGSNQAYGADLYSRGIEAQSNLMGTAENANNQYRSDYANRYNQQAGANANENRRISDLNSRNRAGSRNATRASIEELSRYAQSQQLMNNQTQSDKINAYVYSLYNTAMNPKDRAKLNKMIGVR